MILKKFKTVEGYIGIIYECITMYSDHLCGYVGIPKNHKLYGLEWNQSNYFLNKVWKKFVCSEVEFGKRSIIPIFYAQENEITIAQIINVHGGITYSRNYLIDNEDKNLWWFGLDCAHYGDNRMICNDEYVENEINNLSKQLKFLNDWDNNIKLDDFDDKIKEIF